MWTAFVERILKEEILEMKITFKVTSLNPTHNFQSFCKKL